MNVEVYAGCAAHVLTLRAQPWNYHIVARPLRSSIRGGARQTLASKITQKVARLPIATRALDIEDLTRPVQVVMCPARNNIITVGNCRQCRAFRQIEQGNKGAWLSCSGVRGPVTRSTSSASVQEHVHLPHLCASIASSLATLLANADTLQPWEAIPILDFQTRPVGVALAADLQQLSGSGCDPALRVEQWMSTSFVTVFACMSLADAAQLRANSRFRGVVVVADDDTFLGVVSEPDLDRACGASHAPLAVNP